MKKLILLFILMGSMTALAGNHDQIIRDYRLPKPVDITSFEAQQAAIDTIDSQIANLGSKIETEMVKFRSLSLNDPRFDKKSREISKLNGDVASLVAYKMALLTGVGL